MGPRVISNLMAFTHDALRDLRILLDLRAHQEECRLQVIELQLVEQQVRPRIRAIVVGERDYAAAAVRRDLFLCLRLSACCHKKKDEYTNSQALHAGSPRKARLALKRQRLSMVEAK